MSCSNCPPEACYDNCPQVYSDRCVNYTGNDVPALGIQTNQTLLTIENILIERVVSFLDGTGINITVNPIYYCTLVSQYLPEGTPTLVDVLTALVRAACDLQTQTTANTEAIAALNSEYDVACLEGISDVTNTHEVVQAIIAKLCAVEADLTALALDVDTNYVKLADLDTLIAAYLATIAPVTDQYYTRMVPYTAVEYYGSLSNFDGTGAGLTANGYYKIYLCNGQNGTPDKRGRAAVGAINGVPGGALNPAVDPAYTGNPNYSLYTTTGANSVVLNINQIPSHTHAATASSLSAVIDPGHTHNLGGGATGGSGTIGLDHVSTPTYPTTSSTTNITVNTTTSVINSSVGGGQSHANIQPVLACYYIMYIP